MIAVSEIGVSRTRSPKRSCRPRVRPNTLPPARDVDARDEHAVVVGELGFERGADRVHRAEHRRVVGAGAAARRASGRGRVTKSDSVAAAGACQPPGRLDRVVELVRDRRLQRARCVSSSMPADRSTRAWTSSGSRASHASHLVGRSVALRVAFVVAVPAVGGGLDDGGPASGADGLDHVVHRGRGRDDVVAVDRDVVDAVAGGALLERRRVLRRRRARTRRSRCSRRRRPPAAATPRRGSPLRGTCPCATAPSPKNATATLPSRAQLRRGRGARPRSAGRRPTIPLAPKMPIVGSAMCIEPPRPRFVPCVLAPSARRTSRAGRDPSRGSGRGRDGST